MKILIVDDERLARERLKHLVSGLVSNPELFEASNGREALFAVNASHPDLVLMDIRMPIMDGLESAMHLSRMDNPPSVIFTTAYDQHAVTAFEVNAVDYLLKPIRKERLETALGKVTMPSLQQLDRVRSQQDITQSRSHISVQLRGQITVIPVSEVVYFMADNKYVRVRTATERHFIEDSLVSLEQEFEERFLRIHRNAIVSIAHIRGMEKQSTGRWHVKLKDIDETLEVSRRHTAAVRNWIRG
ncbi:MAG: DNA-binding response regulator [Proteobacteria bacterium]|nr:MAG: DNA-binding response regulator [Pseudomonadota bacterium]